MIFLQETNPATWASHVESFIARHPSIPNGMESLISTSYFSHASMKAFIGREDDVTESIIFCVENSNSEHCISMGSFATQDFFDQFISSEFSSGDSVHFLDFGNNGNAYSLISSSSLLTQSSIFPEISVSAAVI